LGRVRQKLISIFFRFFRYRLPNTIRNRLAIMNIFELLRRTAERKTLKLHLDEEWRVDNTVSPGIKHSIPYAVAVAPNSNQAQALKEDWDAKYPDNGHILLVMTRNTKLTTEWRDWTVGPVFTEDLKKEPQVLLEELFALQNNKEPDPFLAEMKFRAFRARRGQDPQTDSFV